ncbi:unnamed protein product [Prunus armeniaca]
MQRCSCHYHFILLAQALSQFLLSSSLCYPNLNNHVCDAEELFPLVQREDLNMNPTSNDGNEFGLHQPFIDNVRGGAWDLAKEYLSRNPEAIRERGSTTRGTALHLAVALKNVKMAKALVGLMTEDDLEIQDATGQTAMDFAAILGITQLAKVHN